MLYGQKYFLTFCAYVKNVANTFNCKIYQQGYVTGGGITLSPSQLESSTNLRVGGLTIDSTDGVITFPWTAPLQDLYGPYPLVWAYYNGQMQPLTPVLDDNDSPTQMTLDVGTIPSTNTVIIFKKGTVNHETAYGDITIPISGFKVIWLYYNSQMQPCVPILDNNDTPTTATIYVDAPYTSSYIMQLDPDDTLTYSSAEVNSLGGVITIDTTTYGPNPKFYVFYESQLRPVTPVQTPNTAILDLGTIPSVNTHILVLEGGSAVGLQELNGTSQPLSIPGTLIDPRNKMEPLKGSKATVRVVTDDDFDLETIWTDDEKEYYLEVGLERDDDEFTVYWTLDDNPGGDLVDRNLFIYVNGVLQVSAFTPSSGSFQVTRGDTVLAETSTGVAWPSVDNPYAALFMTGKETLFTDDYTEVQNLQIDSVDKDITILSQSYYEADFIAMRSDVFYNQTSGYPVAYSPIYHGASQVAADALAAADTDFYIDGQNYADEWPVGFPAIWRGFMIPDGLQQSWQDRATLEMEFVDGIGLLKNLLFADNDGNYFLGKSNPKDIFYRCIYRLGIPDMNIYIHSDVFEEEMDESEDPMVQVTHQLETYFLSTQTKPLDLAAVMESVLRGYGLEMRQNLGEWWITQIDSLFDSGEQTWYKYSYLTGDFIQTVSKDWTKTLGCADAAVDLYFAGGDQMKIIDKAYRGQILKYEFKAATQINENPNLIPTASGLGYIWEGWTVDPLGSGNVNPGPDNNGARMDSNATRPADPPEITMTSDNIAVQPGDELVFNFNFNNTGPVAFSKLAIQFFNGAQYYNLGNNGVWGSGTLSPTPDPIYTYNGQVLDSPSTPYLWALDSDLSLEIIAEGIPSVLPGSVTIILYNYDYSQNNSLGATENNTPGYPDFSGTTTWNLAKASFAIAQDSTGQAALGTFYIAANVGNPTYTPPILEVLNADDDTAKYVGTLYREDETTPTHRWHRGGLAGYGESKPLMWIIAEMYVRMYQSPFRICTGTIWGWFPQLTRFEIEDWEGVYMNAGTDYESDLMNRANLIQISNEDIIGAQSTIEETDYGQYNDDLPVIIIN